MRDTGVSQGLIVPSMAFLDQPERFNVVPFVEWLRVDLPSQLTDREEIGDVRLTQSPVTSFVPKGQIIAPTCGRGGRS